jgi:hypothetical protein
MIDNIESKGKILDPICPDKLHPWRVLIYGFSIALQDEAFKTTSCLSKDCAVQRAFHYHIPALSSHGGWY